MKVFLIAFNDPVINVGDVFLQFFIGNQLLMKSDNGAELLALNYLLKTFLSFYNSLNVSEGFI